MNVVQGGQTEGRTVYSGVYLLAHARLSEFFLANAPFLVSLWRCFFVQFMRCTRPVLLIAAVEFFLAHAPFLVSLWRCFYVQLMRCTCTVCCPLPPCY